MKKENIGNPVEKLLEGVKKTYIRDSKKMKEKAENNVKKRTSIIDVKGRYL